MNKIEKFERLSKLSNRLSDKQIQFKEGPPMTDGGNIFIPVSSYDFDDLIGLTAHESFHIRAHSFADCLENISNIIAKKYQINTFSAHGISNITEDFRIEQWVLKTFPGFNRKLQQFSEKHVRENQFKEEKLPLIVQLSLTLNQFDSQFRYDLRDLKSIELIDSEYEKIDILKEKMVENVSPEYGVIASNELAKIYVEIRDRLIEESQQEQQEAQEEQQGQQGQQGQSGQQGQQRSQNDQSMVPDDLEDFEEDFEEELDLDDSMDQSEGPSQQGKGNEKGPSKDQGKSDIKEIQDFEQKEQKSAPGQSGSGESKPPQQSGQQLQSLTEEEKKKLNEVHQIVNKIGSGKEIDEKVLEEALEEAVDEINKILEKGEAIERKEELTNPEGQRCVRVKKIEDLRKGAKIVDPSAEEIVRKNRGLIRQITQILGLKSEKVFSTRGHKVGRLNRDIIRTVASDYTNTNCFSRIETKGKGKIMFVLDLSGSMRDNNAINLLKEAIITIAKALENSANLRIVGYTSGHTFVFKEFNEPTDLKKLQLIGMRKEGAGTPTGISLETEFTFMKRSVSEATIKIPVVLITDGQPDSPEATKKAISKIRKHAKIFAIGLHYSGYDWNDLFGENNYVTVNDERELKLKLLSLSRKIVKQF